MVVTILGGKHVHRPFFLSWNQLRNKKRQANGDLNVSIITANAKERIVSGHQPN